MSILVSTKYRSEEEEIISASSFIIIRIKILKQVQNYKDNRMEYFTAFQLPSKNLIVAVEHLFYQYYLQLLEYSL